MQRYKNFGNSERFAVDRCARFVEHTTGFSVILVAQGSDRSTVVLVLQCGVVIADESRVEEFKVATDVHCHGGVVGVKLWIFAKFDLIFEVLDFLLDTVDCDAIENVGHSHCVCYLIVWQCVRFIENCKENTRLEVRLDDETVWLTTIQMSQLFNREDSNIRRHIIKIFSDGELPKENNVHFLHVIGVKKPVPFYNLDVIISVGYRVMQLDSTNSIRLCFQFFSRVLKNYK